MMTRMMGTIASAALIGAAAMAEDAQNTEKGWPGGFSQEAREGAQRPGMRAGGPGAAEWENPDTNGDMIISEEETQAAVAKMTERLKAAHAERNKRVLEYFDADGDGTLNEAELAKAKEAGAKIRGGMEEMRKQALQEFDADGDGKLSEAERAKAREAMEKRREGMKNRERGAERPKHEGGAERPKREGKK